MSFVLQMTKMAREIDDLLDEAIKDPTEKLLVVSILNAKLRQEASAQDPNIIIALDEGMVEFNKMLLAAYNKVHGEPHGNIQ